MTERTNIVPDACQLGYELGKYEAQLRVQASKVAEAYDKYARHVGQLASTLSHLSVSALQEAMHSLLRQSHRMERLLGGNALQHFQTATRCAFSRACWSRGAGEAGAVDRPLSTEIPYGLSPEIQEPPPRVAAAHPRLAVSRSVEALRGVCHTFGFAVADLSCLSQKDALLSLVTSRLELPLMLLPMSVTRALSAVAESNAEESTVTAACDALSAAIGPAVGSKVSRWIVVATVEEARAWQRATAKFSQGEVPHARRTSVVHRYLVRSANTVVSMLRSAHEGFCERSADANEDKESLKHLPNETSHTDVGAIGGVDLIELLATIETASTPSSSIVCGDWMHCVPSTLPDPPDASRCPPATSTSGNAQHGDLTAKIPVVLPLAPRFTRKRSRSLGSTARAERRQFVESQRVEFEQFASEDDENADDGITDLCAPRVVDGASVTPGTDAGVEHNDGGSSCVTADDCVAVPRFQTSSTVRAFRKEISSYIDTLHGELLPVSSYQPTATHLIVAEAATERTEKYLCFCASGKSIVSCRYLRDSAEHGEWLSLRLGSKGSELYELSPYRRRYHRIWSASAALAKHRLGRSGTLPLPFSKWRVVLFASRAVASSISSILEAGGCTFIVCDRDGVQDGQWAAGRSSAVQRQLELPQWLRDAAAAASQSELLRDKIRVKNEEREETSNGFDNAAWFLSSEECVTHILVECSLRECRFEAPLALPAVICKDAELMRQKVFTLEILYQVLCRDAHEDVFSVHTGCLLPGARERLPMSCQVFCEDALPSNDANQTSTATTESTISAAVE